MDNKSLTGVLNTLRNRKRGKDYDQVMHFIKELKDATPEQIESNKGLIKEIRSELQEALNSLPQ